MSAIQDLAPFIGAYQGKIRRAKDASGMTLEELSNESGVRRFLLCREPIIRWNTSGSTALQLGCAMQNARVVARRAVRP